MSADLFDFHGGGDGGWADDGWREKEADTAEPDEECGPRCQCFFFFLYGVTSFRGVFSASPLGSARTLVRKILQGVNSA